MAGSEKWMGDGSSSRIVFTNRAISTARVGGVANGPNRLRSEGVFSPSIFLWTTSLQASTELRSWGLAGSDSQLGEIIDPVFPYPVQSFRRLIPQVTTVEVAAEEEDQLNVRSIGVAKLVYLGGLFLPPLVRVREVAR